MAQLMVRTEWIHMFVGFLSFGNTTKREGWRKLELTTRLKAIEGSKRTMKIISLAPERNLMSTQRCVEGTYIGGSNANTEEIVNDSTYEENQ